MHKSNEDHMICLKRTCSNHQLYFMKIGSFGKICVFLHQPVKHNISYTLRIIHQCVLFKQTKCLSPSWTTTFTTILSEDDMNMNIYIISNRSQHILDTRGQLHRLSGHSQLDTTLRGSRRVWEKYKHKRVFCWRAVTTTTHGSLISLLHWEKRLLCHHLVCTPWRHVQNSPLLSVPKMLVAFSVNAAREASAF